METRLRLLLGAARRRSRCAGKDRPQRRRTAVARLNPRKVSTSKVPVVFDSARRRLARRAPGQRHQRRLDRAQDELPQGQDGRADFRQRASTSSTIRCAAAACARGRSTPRASPASRMALIEDGVLKTWLLDCATARELGLVTTGHAARERLLDAVAGRRPICIWSRASSAPDELIKDIDEGFYVTDLIGSGANMVTGDYSRGAAGLLDRERRAHLSGERGDDRRPSARHLPHRHAGERSAIPLWHQRADRAAGRTDHCRTSDLLRDRERLATAVREAGALAKNSFAAR